ncbi:MAG TPA: hypothetical protein VFU12_17475 [Glycomyces sp.]|nr:hypothetical protein [Glycomyces sp.]
MSHLISRVRQAARPCCSATGATLTVRPAEETRRFPAGLDPA